MLRVEWDNKENNSNIIDVIIDFIVVSTAVYISAENLHTPYVHDFRPICCPFKQRSKSSWIVRVGRGQIHRPTDLFIPIYFLYN